jgi:importin subunit alpha-6/7
LAYLPKKRSKLYLLCITQAVIEAGLIAPLVNLLQNAEFDIKKEAAQALTNVTSGGTHEHIK